MKWHDSRSIICCLPLFAGIFFLNAGATHSTTVYEYDFEAGWNTWYTDNGVWEVGTPTAGPASVHSGTQCAGTVLGGFYPANSDSRLISPSINLPGISGDEEIYLRFWQWFSYAGGEEGYVQISYYDYGLEEWSDFSTIGNAIYDSSPGWSRGGVDLTDYAGEKVRIAFNHTADWIYESYGWYIDDVEIIHTKPGFNGDFEDDWSDWYADRGVWQVGVPTIWPDSAHGGIQCAGTILDGNYPSNTDSRLITPSIQLPEVSGGDEIFICFWHWLSYAGGEAAYVQVSVYIDSTGDWSAWETVGIQLNNSSIWSYVCRDLTDYAGEKVRIAFNHTADWIYESSGWYIDDVEFVGFTPPPPPPSGEATFDTATGLLHIPTVIVDDADRYTVDMQHQSGRLFEVTDIVPQE